MIDYDWKAIQSFYDANGSYRSLFKEFGVSHKLISKAGKAGLFKSRSLSAAVKISQAINPRVVKDETRSKMSEHAKRRGLGGVRNSKKFSYVQRDGTTVVLDSSYEVRVAESLDANKVRWIRPGKFKWIDDNGGSHTYTPDFYLPTYDVYLDPKHKGIIPLHARKIQLVQEQNPIRVLVLEEKELTFEAIINKVSNKGCW